MYIRVLLGMSFYQACKLLSRANIASLSLSDTLLFLSKSHNKASCSFVEFLMKRETLPASKAFCICNTMPTSKSIISIDIQPN